MDFSVSEGRMPINADGLTPLHIAALHGQFKIFKALPYTSLVLSENYVLTNTLHQRMKNNVLPFLTSLLLDIH